MIKILGFNILRDFELEKLKNENWEKALKLFKIKQLYRIKWDWKPKPKCSHCDKDRNIEVTLPDGTKTYVKCSCASSKTSFEIDKAKDYLYYIIRKNDKVWISDGLSDWSIEYRIIYNEKQFNEVEHLDHCYFVNKKLAEKALKLFKEQRK